MMFFMYYQYLFSYTNPIKKFKSVPNGLKFYSYTNFKMESENKIKNMKFFFSIFDFRFLEKVPLKARLIKNFQKSNRRNPKIST